MSAIDDLITALRGYKSSSGSQVVIAPIDTFVAALQLIQGGGASTPGGNASGDLSGTYPGPTVAKIQTVAVSAAAPALGQKLTLVGGVWTPQ